MKGLELYLLKVQICSVGGEVFCYFLEQCNRRLFFAYPKLNQGGRNVKKILWFILSFCFVIHLQAGEPSEPHWLDSLACRQNNAAIFTNYGNNKEIPAAYRTAILAALSYYPELKDVPIEFRVTSIKTTMAALPKIFSVFKKPENRNFVIKINKSKRSGAILLKELSFNAQVGVIGHELGHITDYMSMNTGEVIQFAMDYLSIEKRIEIEARTDLIAVEHGLGWQLLQFGREVFYNPDIPESYKAYKRSIYFEPIELRLILGFMPAY